MLGGMCGATATKPNRARIIAELYVRAYWRYYATAGVWVFSTTTFFQLIHRH